MPDSDRLHELHRQRALIAEHLAWIDRDIVRLTRSDTPVAAPSPTRPNQLSPTRPKELSPDELINELAEETADTESLISKTGCWLVFATVILLCLGAVVLFVVLKY